MLAFRKLMDKVFVDRTLLQYIALIVQQTRTSKAVYLGASPRASVAMLQSSKAYALLQGRDFVTPEDIKFVAPPYSHSRSRNGRLFSGKGDATAHRQSRGTEMRGELRGETGELRWEKEKLSLNID